MVKVKICGITSLGDARAAVDFGADALGFVFAESPRRVTPQTARAIVKGVGPFVTSVGVFVNEKIETVGEIAGFCGLDAVQLHGDETPAYTKKVSCCKVIKAFRVGEHFNLKAVLRYAADAYLFDARSDGRYGGSGRTFDWKLLRGALPKPVILSGGLHPGNVREAIRVVSPYAVDVSSGVERRPGVKDRKLLREFIQNAKKA